MRKLSLSLMSILAGAVLISSSCGSDDPEPVNPEELITTVNVSFTNNGNTDEVVMATFRDIDGPGGENPTIDNITLNANTSYAVRVEFLNEAANPTENVTEEVLEEALEHQVFYFMTGNANITFTYNDQDTNGNPIGIQATAMTGAANNGALNIVLLHEPVKNATGVGQGIIGNAGGEEDIRVQFNVSLQ